MSHKWQRQRGAVTLFVSLVILVGISSLVGIGTHQAGVEQNTSASDKRGKEAFEAAEAGIEKGIAYIQANSATVSVDTNGDGFIDSYSNAAITNASLTNGAKFTVTYSNATPGNLDVLDVTSTGTSIDSTVTRTVRMTILRKPTATSSVTAGIVAKGTATLSGNMSVTNTVTNPTIWSGSSTILDGAAKTHGMDGATSDKNSTDTDIAQNDTNLASLSTQAFFMNFFSSPPDTVRTNADILLTNPGVIDSLNGVTGKLIWVDQTSGSATINSGVTIGSPEKPVVLIVNGNLTLNGTAAIYGIIYTTGDWINNGGGTAEIYGSVIVNGQFQSTGTPDVIYDPLIISNINSNLVIYAKLPGSWRDI